MLRLSDLTDERPLEQILGIGLRPGASHTISLAPSSDQYWAKLWAWIAIAGGYFTTVVFAGWWIVSLLICLFGLATSRNQTNAMGLAITFAAGLMLGLPSAFILGLLTVAIVAGVVLLLVWAGHAAQGNRHLKDRSASAAGAMTSFALALPWLAVLNDPPARPMDSAVGFAGLVLAHLAVACPALQLAGLLASIRDLRRRRRRPPPGRLRFRVRGLLVLTGIVAVLLAGARAAGWLTPVMALGLAGWIVLATISHLVLTGTLNSRAKLRLHRRRRARRQAGLAARST